jgi:guanyl-specific ribonuclease Sa
MIRAVIGLLLAVVALAGCQAAPNPAPAATSPAASVADGAVPDCTAELPPEAHDVVGDIEAGGPYEYPRNDGVTFGNREGLLPDQGSGYYREFTVKTPGANNRRPPDHHRWA